MQYVSRKQVTFAFLFLALAGPPGAAHATGILTSPSSSYSYSGALAGEVGNTPGGTLTPESFNVPVVIVGDDLPFAQHTSRSDQWGYATSRYDLELDSVLYPDFDTLTLQLQIGVSGEVSGTWDSWSEWTNSLAGSLATEFQVQEWSQVDLDLSIAWSLVELGSEANGSAMPGTNVITVRGPLEAEPANQTAYLLDRSLPISPNWSVDTSVASNTLEYIVPGTYEVRVHSQMGSDGYRSSIESTAFGIDIGNNVSIQVTQAISPTACLPGVPCAADADLDGVNGVLINDFAAWYDAPSDVTNDGLVNGSDVAAMAYLTGVSTADVDQDNIVDAVEAYLPVASVENNPPAAVAIELHPARPNPFNPRTTLSYTLATGATVSLSVYDVKGNHVRTLIDGEARAGGRHEADWDGSDRFGQAAPAGVYIYRLAADGAVLTGNMMLLK